jgi:hypothetical protein
MVIRISDIWGSELADGCMMGLPEVRHKLIIV